MNYIENNSSEMEVMLNTRATNIIMENGRAVGVRADGPKVRLLQKQTRVL